MERYIVYHEESTKESILTAFALLFKLYEESEVTKDAIFLVPQLGTLFGDIEDALGEKIIKQLSSKKTINLPGSFRLNLETSRTLRSSFSTDVILSIFPTEDMIDQIDDAENLKTVIIVPWNPEEVRVWINAWNPTMLGDQLPPPKQLKLKTGVIEELKRLTMIVNLKTALSHPSDINRAIESFEKLRSERMTYDPKDIKVWALQKGWRPVGARGLMNIAETILEGKNVRKR